MNKSVVNWVCILVSLLLMAAAIYYLCVGDRSLSSYYLLWSLGVFVVVRGLIA